MTFAVGDRLRENRNARNLTIEEVSMKTRISKEYIKAMENEEYDVFPARVYLLNFMKKYSEFLGLDTDSIIHRVRNEYRSAESVKLSKIVKVFSKTKVKRQNRKVVIPVILVILVIVAGLSAVLHFKVVDLGGGAEKAVSTAVTEPVEIIKKGIDIVMVVKDDTWVRATVDGKSYIEKILPAGYEERLAAEKELKLRIGNVHGIDLWQGQEKIDVISGNMGDVNEITFKYSSENNEINIERKAPFKDKE